MAKSDWIKEKKHTANEFYVRPIVGPGHTYYQVIDGYDMSQASLEVTEDAANKMAAKLNAMRNERLFANG
ncbi:MAG: hypothetical protein NC548_53145 [Lachnospiraceae bacterium]|nr:hypothetical protein [Lachnospiraceae bacterium]